MKLLKYLTIFSIVVGVSSCGDPELPYEPFEDMQYGAFARVLSNTGEFNFFDVAGSSYAWTVEFYDENKGKNVAAYDWTVSYVDVANGGANNVGPVSFRSYSSSDFTTNADGLPGLSATFTFQEALDALGLTIGDINGGDSFVFSATLTKTDGSVFTRANTGPNVISSAPFSAFFELSAPVVCPSNLGGTFDAFTTGWCGGSHADVPTAPAEFTWLDQGSGVYSVEGGDFSYGAYFICYGGWEGKPLGTLQIQDACGKLSPLGASQWGEVYQFNAVSVSGTSLTLDWENDYGEAGITVLTRQDGANWPAGLTN